MACGGAQAQSGKTAHIYKLDGGRAALSGEWRLAGEWQHRSRRRYSLVAGVGVLQATHRVADGASRTPPAQDPAQPDTPPPAYDYGGLYAGSTLFRYHSLRPVSFVPTVASEQLLGGMLQIGLRRYVWERDAPTRLYTQLMLGYGLWQSRYYSREPRLRVGTAWVHRPAGQLVVGWQWILGHHRVFTIDVAGGAEVWGMLPFAPSDGLVGFEKGAALYVQPVLHAQVGITIFKYR